MTQRTLTEDEQHFLTSLREELQSHPKPLDFSQTEAQSLIAMILSAAKPASPAEASIGPVCQTPMLAEWLGISRQGVNKGVRERRILGVQIGRSWHYPTWQIGSHQILPAATRLFKHVLPANPSPLHLAALAYWAWKPSPDDSALTGLSPAAWIQHDHDYATLAAYADETFTPGVYTSPRRTADAIRSAL